MADIAQIEESSEPAAAAKPKSSARFALSLGGLVLTRMVPARRAAMLFGLAVVSAIFSLSFLIEETLAGFSWGLLLTNDGVQAPTGLALTLMIGTIATNRLRRPARCRRSPSGEDMRRAVEILASQPNAGAGLVRIGDKKLFFSRCGTAFIMYAQQGRSWVALFDPVGPAEAWRDIVIEFMDAARKAGCRAVFYQVSQDFLPLAVEMGLKPYKLGEQAVVDLSGFDLKGSARIRLRRAVNRCVKDGLEFSMIEAEDVHAVMHELRTVSDAWLQSRNTAEKGFSLGTFQPDYLASGPVAVVRVEGRIVAFVNILATGSEGDACIDLMRHLPDTHPGMMVFLFVRIMEHMKARGFRTLNLGMAPLAGLSTHSKAPLWNHLGDRIFNSDVSHYNFRGVQLFKSKFDPQWQPRYLAVSGSGMPVVSMIDVTMLIGGGLKGVLRK